MADMTTNRKAGRPQGAKQLMPTAADRRRYIQLLRKRADAGDAQAITALLNLEKSDG
ncbi:hypothetical protein [Halomonas sp. BM-2019]|uniref:hypothetical protein n=1 Tax=Halomonas sp. BM-2019 TaxID=2811227 RepID=UPI001B3C2AB1|nr:MAG: hypothetical protein J5F18_14850 [Halomonas sp. BM-2019]